ncbi:phage tail protein, partial [Streptomyces scabiei]|uniref:phage tail protein n=1 Tax=Streptomyces scabiei TaxID=1930 RepID=UPI0039EFA39D
MSTPTTSGAQGADRVGDGFDEAAAAKLWALLPAVHRSADSTVVDAPGPLRELLGRIAGQVAVTRRGLDRLWENQSVETCDDWVLPYLADLLGTNLVASMDAREQRLDVANTIAYRRRKGTVGLLEQLAADVTGWECRVVEFFRLLGRTRHGLDPEIGRPADAVDPPAARRLQTVSGLTGLLTGTAAGGYADLRQALGARQRT